MRPSTQRPDMARFTNSGDVELMLLSKSLSVLALIGIVLPSAHALSIKDDQVKLDIGVRLQTRLASGSAENATGDDYDIITGANGKTDPIHFSIPRSRLYLKGKYGDDWKFQLTFMADDVDAEFTKDNRGAQVRYAWIERIFKGETLTHSIKAGLDKPNYNESDVISSSARLFPSVRATSNLLKPRGTGLGYQLDGSMFKFNVDVQNNLADGAKENPDETNGLWISGRVEFSPVTAWYIPKRTESFLGKEGTGLNFGLGYGMNNDDQENAAVGSVRNETGMHIDVLGHWNALTAIAAVSTRSREDEVIVSGATTETDSLIYTAQVGWAFPMENGHVIEPAIRYTMIDNNTDDDNEASVYGNGDNGGSGSQFDIGVNYYINGHSNKLQLAYQSWTAEDGDGTASIIRLQQQLNF